MKAKLILSVIVVGLVVFFVVQNVGAVGIRFLFWSFFGLRVSTFRRHRVGLENIEPVTTSRIAFQPNA